MPSPSRRLSAGETRRRSVSPTTIEPSSGSRNPLAIPSSVDFPDPFSPTSAGISPARQSTLTSRSACTAPNAFDTPCSLSTGPAGETWWSPPPAGANVDIDALVLLSAPLLRDRTRRVHLLEQAQRDQGRRRGLQRVALDAGVAVPLVLQLDRETDLRRDLRPRQLHH